MRLGSIAWVAVWGFALHGALAHAQIPRAAYTPPAGPTLPYQLDYFRPQLGPLDQYNQFVAPKENLSNTLGNITQRQSYDYQALERRVAEGDQIRESRAAATGTAAGFMNYSHYYGKGVARSSAGARPAQQRTRLPSMSMPGIGGMSSGINYSR